MKIVVEDIDPIIIETSFAQLVKNLLVFAQLYAYEPSLYSKLRKTKEKIKVSRFG